MTPILPLIAGAAVAWDGVLHLVTLATGRATWVLAAGTIDPAAALPWALYPTFPSWAAYDLFWAALHLGAAALILWAWRRRWV